MKICIVIANYYPKISKDLLIGASKTLKSKGFKNIKKIIAPGVFEIPVTIAKNINKFDAFVALGCVIKGKTPHFDFISSSTTDAIMKLSIQNKKPIGNGIITCLNRKQAKERVLKGIDALHAVISVLSQKNIN